MRRLYTNWNDLVDLDRPLAISVDTEYQERKTLTVQFAVRLGETVYVQVYRHPSVPKPDDATFGKSFRKPLANLVPKLRVRTVKLLDPKLSPARVVADLLGWADPECDVPNEDDPRVPSNSDCQIVVKLVGHGLKFDLLRAFGREYLGRLLAPENGKPKVAVRDGKVLGLVGLGGTHERFRPPIVEYVEVRGLRLAIRLDTLDTNCVVGPTKLDQLAEAYLGIGKEETFKEVDKSRMETVFADPRTRTNAYRYAARDAVIALCVSEKLQLEHEQLYSEIGLPPEAVTKMNGTPGLRVANLVLAHARYGVACGSRRLGAEGAKMPASSKKLRDLVSCGNASRLVDGRVTRYGRQTAGTHGGLLYSRCPTQFFDSALGQFRDLDLSSCYPAILADMDVYLGRPMVFEPGNDDWCLKDAIELLEKRAAGKDAWYVRVSGRIEGIANTLIPSTREGLTTDNYRKRAPRRVSATAHKRTANAWTRERDASHATTAIYTDEVVSGIVTWATWLMIQTLPLEARRSYEQLRAESIVFYAAEWTADNGPAFDSLVERRTTGSPVDWRQELDLDARALLTTEEIDEKYVALRYPVRQLARQLIELRKSKGAATSRGKAIKVLANTLYGAFASPLLPTSNPVAANVVTGTARALAYAMANALNAHQVITDGTMYRADQIPAGTFADVLRKRADYPIRRPSGSIEYLDASTVPAPKSRTFRRWYVERVAAFFGVTDMPEYLQLFELHRVEHKSLPETDRFAFDAALLDGAGTYAKLVVASNGWKVADMKARGFKDDAKRKLGSYLIDTYSKDTFQQPSPLVEQRVFLDWPNAIAASRRVVAGDTAAELPLGWEQKRVVRYKIVKPSMYLFRSERQRKMLLKDWSRMRLRTDCGPELLATRASFDGKLSRVAEAIFAVIREDKVRLNSLNVDRLWRPGALGTTYLEEATALRTRVRASFLAGLVAKEVDEPTGLAVDAEALRVLCESARQVAAFDY